MAIDLDTYSRDAERFISAIDLEYYRHFSGQKEDFEIEQIYDAHGGLFDRDAVEALRELAEQVEGDEARRRRYLLRLAVEGLIGRETKAQTAELAAREARMEVDLGEGEKVPYRQAPVLQANEPNPERRALIERRRMELLDAELNPLLREQLETEHRLAAELGWSDYRAMCEQLAGFDLGALEAQTAAFSAATDDRYRALVDPAIVAELGVGLDGLRRADMARFFRGPKFDALFPADKLLDSFERTLALLGFDPREQVNVKLDVEDRPLKSPRAFCAPVRVPQEVYLVIPRNGGREDFAALFHEGGHTEHYANVDPALAFEFRHLGDNSVTESFAFLFEHLTEDAAWLQWALGVEAPNEYLEYARAGKLIFLRRYAAKIAYELHLHGGEPLGEMPDLYAQLLGDAVGIEWPAVSYLSDVDGGFYVASYLRAWALETRWRTLLRERWGELWFTQREAGDFLRLLWSEGQRLRADELLKAQLGETLDFGVLLAEFDA